MRYVKRQILQGDRCWVLSLINVIFIFPKLLSDIDDESIFSKISPSVP